jgi:hypothetical protein
VEAVDDDVMQADLIVGMHGHRVPGPGGPQPGQEDEDQEAYRGLCTAASPGMPLAVPHPACLLRTFRASLP